MASDDESDDSMFDNDNESSSESESDDGRQELKGRARWLKKAVTTEEKSAKDVKRDQKKLDGGRKKKDVAAEPTPVAKKTPSNWLLEDKMTEEELDKKVTDLVSSRGRKNTDAREVLRQLEVLTKAARLHGARKEIPVLMHLISAMFDSHRNIDDYMELNQWRTCHRSLTRILTLLESSKKLVLGTIGSDEVSDLLVGAHLKAAVKKDDEEAEANKSEENKNLLKVVGSIESFILRLEDEYTKSLQQINPHTQVSRGCSDYLCSVCSIRCCDDSPASDPHLTVVSFVGWSYT